MPCPVLLQNAWKGTEIYSTSIPSIILEGKIAKVGWCSEEDTVVIQYRELNSDSNVCGRVGRRGMCNARQAVTTK